MKPFLMILIACAIGMSALADSRTGHVQQAEKQQAQSAKYSAGKRNQRGVSRARVNRNKLRQRKNKSISKPWPQNRAPQNPTK